MFYCDDCAREKRYPVAGDDRLRSHGNCEACGKMHFCTNLFPEALSLGPVTIFIVDRKSFMRPTQMSFFAPKGKLRVVGFQTSTVFGDTTTVFVPVNYLQDFSSRTVASRTIRKLQRQTKAADQIYFLHDENGRMVHLEKPGKKTVFNH